MNIVIADAHSLCREALSEYIKHADLDLTVGEVPDYAGLMDYLAREKPAMALVDMRLPGLPMIDNFDDLSGTYPSLRIGVILSDDDPENADPSLGAQGIFPRNLTCKLFLHGIHRVLAGERFRPEENMANLYDCPSEKQALKSMDEFHLTQREKQVLSYLVHGATNKDIARALDLQVVTIKLHVRGICRKISAKNRTQAALIAMENGWNA